MIQTAKYDVVIIGGSYAGLAAAMALGRALRRVLIIDNGLPANRQTPYSHNFLTNDGKTPGQITAIARQQVAQYATVVFEQATATAAIQTPDGLFCITTGDGKNYTSNKVVLATGITDIMPDIPGFSESWGISVLHCPYCHGYEVRGVQTGILGNGDSAYDFATLIANWTNHLTIYTNGKATFTPHQLQQLYEHNIQVCEAVVESLQHSNGIISHIVLGNGYTKPITALYARLPFKLHSNLHLQLGCELTNDGYIKTDAANKTTTPGVFACGDNVSRMRTVANAVAAGTTTGMMINKELSDERFN